MSAPAVAVSAMHRGPVTWYVYLLLGYITFALNVQGNVLPFLKADLDLSYRMASLHSSAMAAGMIVVGLFGDRIIRLTGRRLGLRLGALGVVAGLATLALAPSVTFSIAGCLIIGLFGSLIPAIGFAVLADDQPRYRDVAYGESNAVSYAFAIFAPLAMSASVAASLGWRVPLIAGVLVGLVLVWTFRAAPLPQSLRPAASKTDALPPAFWAYLFLLCLSGSIEFAVLLFAPTFLEQVVGLSKATAAGASAAFFLAMLGGRLAGSVLVRIFPVPGLLVASLFVALAGFFLYWSGEGPLAAVPGLFIAGLGIALLFPLTLSLAVNAAGDREDAASARVPLSAGLAILIAPAVLGWIADETGLRNALLVIPALIGAAFVCFAVARSLERRRVLPV